MACNYLLVGIVTESNKECNGLVSATPEQGKVVNGLADGGPATGENSRTS